MNPYRMTRAPRSWEPKLSPAFVRWFRPFRRWQCRRQERLEGVEVAGAETVRQAIQAGHGVLITPNHSTHADAFSMYEAAETVGHSFFFMATWHVFDSQPRPVQWILQKHGVFSIDREGTDLQAFKRAVRILQDSPHPLVIFPEGEVYHLNERVTPFRDGAAAVAISAAKGDGRPIVCVPCALRYHYLEDPTPSLLSLMETLEQAVHWRPRPDRPLSERIYALAEALMALKEIEFLGSAATGSLSERTEALAQEILGRLESRHQIQQAATTIPERVKNLRGRILKRLEESGPSDERKALDRDLDEIFLVVQLFSYPGDYVAEDPSLERLAETLDKFEEDVLGKYSATVRGSRAVRIQFGEPIPVEPTGNRRQATRDLTKQLESQVQDLIDGLPGATNSS